MPDTTHAMTPSAEPHYHVDPATSDIATAFVDPMTGNEEMVGRSDADFRPLVQRLLVMDRRHAAEIFEERERLGRQTDDAASLVGLVHTAVAIGRDRTDSLDASAIGAMAGGEEEIVKTYDSAIEKVADHPDHIALLTTQRDDLKFQIAALRSQSRNLS